MVRQGPRYWARRNPALARALRQNWQHLPPNLRKNAANVAVIRFGTACFIALIITSLAQTAYASTPVEFMTTLLSLNSLVAVVGVLAAIIILLIRSMAVAPRFIEAYAEMMPENEEMIREMFDQRGVADAIAPWIMSRQGRIKGILSRFAARFIPQP